MRTAICPGSFDPITLGHLNIIRRVSRIFDRVVVLIAVNSGKTQPMFTIEERVDMVRRACERYPNVTVDSSDTLLAEYVKRYENPVLVKGLRAASDFEYEFQMDLINSAQTSASSSATRPSRSSTTSRPICRRSWPRPSVSSPRATSSSAMPSARQRLCARAPRTRPG